jgi:transposase InsO family protein
MSNTASATTFTAAQIATCLGVTPQAVRKTLRGIEAASVKIVCGVETAAWNFEQLPEKLRTRLNEEAGRRSYRNAQALLASPPTVWQPALALNNICRKDLEIAQKLQRALRPWLAQQHTCDLASSEMERLGVVDYAREFGHSISFRYWRELFMRTLKRDGGAEDWGRLEIYLPGKLTPKAGPCKVVLDALVEQFPALDSFIASCSNPPTEAQRKGVWGLALGKYKDMVLSGCIDKKRAAAQTRAFLFAKASFLAPSRDALLKVFNRKAARFEASGWNIEVINTNNRLKNGTRVQIPLEDLEKLRHSAAFKNGARIDAAWREEYAGLSEATKRVGKNPNRAPRSVHKLLIREKVDALHAIHQRGTRAVKVMVGGVDRQREGSHSCHQYVVDDMTSNIEIALQYPDGTWSLLVPQIVAVMDSTSNKFVGWAVSTDAGPTAELSCAAVLDAFRRHGVPKQLGVENGLVFGKALNINGKADEQGRTVVAGLAQYGCEVRHFDKMSPTSKAELEKGFDLIQQRMERHPGYTGRLQMIDASDDFKREQRLIRSGKIPGTEYRYTFQEFLIVLHRIFEDYNSKPQHGQLKGLSPNEAFESLKDANDPPITIPREFEWLLANARYRVTVELGGVRMRHYGRSLRVRGGRLLDLVGKELWALIQRSDDSVVTFMNLDYSSPFTMEICERPSICEKLVSPGSEVLARELAKKNEHVAAVRNEYKDLIQRYGNPRRQLLNEIRQQQNAPGPAVDRPLVIPETMQRAGLDMEKQREDLHKHKTERTRRLSSMRRKAERAGISPVLLDDTQEHQEGLDLIDAARKEHERGRSYILDPSKTYQEGKESV